MGASPARFRSKGRYAISLCGGMLILCGALAAQVSALSPVPMEGALAGEEVELLKEEEPVSIVTRDEQPISIAPFNVYVLTDEDIRHSGATDIPTVLRRIPGLDIMQVTGADSTVSARGDHQLFANKILVMVDGRSTYVDGPWPVFWKSLPVTLPEIKRIEVLKGPASVVYGFNSFHGIINIITKSARELNGTNDRYNLVDGSDVSELGLSGFANFPYQKIGKTLSGVSRRGRLDWKANVGIRGDWDNALNAEVAVHYVVSATYPLIEFFTALTCAAHHNQSDGGQLHIAESSRRLSLLAQQGGVAVAVYNALTDRH